MQKNKIMWISLTLLALLFVAIVLYLNHPKFGRAPRGERLARIEKSPNFSDGKFHNQSPTPQIVSDQGKLRVMWDFLFEKRKGNRPDKPIIAIKTDLFQLNSKEDLIVWFGHSSYLLQSGGKRFLIDPVFERASPVPFVNRAFKGTTIYKAEDMPAIDFLVITHDHWDHLDYATVKKLKTKYVICPLGVGEYFEMWGFSNIIELDWNENQSVDSTEIYCLPARHFSGRSFKSNQTLWASFMLQTQTQTIFIGGDGGYDQHFKQIAQQFPSIDIAILENGQYSPNWPYIHLLPENLHQAMIDLNAHRYFAFHNSKYALSKHSWDEPLLNAKKNGIKMPIIGEIIGL